MPISLEKYSTNSYPFPKDDINPNDKNLLWGKKWCEALYSCYKRGKTVVPYSAIQEMKELRDLADGRQSILRYQKILLDDADEKTDTTGYMNINWDVYNPMPKFLRIVEGMMAQTQHQVRATAIDPSASLEKEEAKLNMVFRMRYKTQMQEIEKMLGMVNSDQFIPDNMEELNIYEGAGGLRLAKEIEIEQGIDYSFYISSWEDQVKPKLIRDFCVLGYSGSKDFTDQYTTKVKCRYVDPAKFVGLSARDDQRKLVAGGELIQVPISDLRKILNIPEDELRLLAKEYDGLTGNVSVENYTYDDETRTANYDSLLVDVMDVEWKSVNSEYYTTRKTSHNNEMTYKEDYGKVFDTERKKTSKYDIHVVYRCKWIVGTDYAYDFGLQYDIPRPGKKEAELSFHFFRMAGRSLVSLAETNLHQLALAFYRLQNAIALAAPPGISIEFGSLSNMAIGKNKKMSPLDILKIYRQTGTLIWRATTHADKFNSASGVPIKELVGGIGNQLQEFLSIFQFNINAIREITGINQVADASTPEKDVSVAGSEMALSATNNALRPIYSGYIFLKEQTAKNMSLRLQLLIKHNKKAYKGYMPVIGELGVQIISVGADVVDADFAIKYEAKPGEKRKSEILQAAMAAMNPDRDGIIGIELPDYLMITRLLDSASSLKFAEAYLNYKTKKNKEKQLQLQRENMQLDAQREENAIAKKAEAERQKMIDKNQLDFELYEKKAKVDDYYNELEHQRRMKELEKQSGLNIAENVIDKGIGATAPATV